MNEIPINAKVELLPGRDEVYQFAVAGSRATVRKRRIDDQGFPLVYVEWDKDHWKYNGEPDGWTFESHFKAIEPSLGDRMVQEATNRREGERCPNCGHEHDEQNAKTNDFIETLHKAVSAATEGEGYFMVTISPERDPRLPGVVIYRPKVFSAILTDDALDMIEAQIVHLASVAHTDMIKERMRRREQE